MRALLLVLTLTACAPQPPAQAPTHAAAAQTNEERLAQMPSWDGARTAGVDFRAIGQEPGWLLDIYQRERIRLLWDYGDSLADFPLSEPTSPREGATRYDTQAAGRTLSITITRFPCQDAMSGEAYPATVELVIDGRTLNGCGRSV
jgi:putative lipoprotein